MLSCVLGTINTRLASFYIAARYLALVELLGRDRCIVAHRL